MYSAYRAYRMPSVLHAKDTLARLCAEDKRNLTRALGMNYIEMSLLYSADIDGCSPDVFHKKCNGHSPVVVLVYGLNGYTYGGYAGVPWTAANKTYIADDTAFLFRLRKEFQPDYVRFPATDRSTGVFSGTNCGPWFGTMGGRVALQIFTGPVPMVETEMAFYFQCDDLTVAIENGFESSGLASEELHGGEKRIKNIEVYTVKEVQMYEADEGWRKGFMFHDRTLAELKAELAEFQPPRELLIPKVNILLVGQVGAGKSSFYNTLHSSYRGHVTGKATSASSEQSVTTKYRQYTLRPRRGEESLRLRLCDTMGLEDQHGLNINDVTYLLDGHVENGFQFNPAVPMTPQHPNFYGVAKLSDRMHVVAMVIDATTVTSMSAQLLGKLRQIRQHANQRGIPVAVLLTKIDEICEQVKRSVSATFHSMAVQDHVDIVAEKLGILRNCVLPVKNYHSEIALDDSIDILAFYTLRQLVRMADYYFEDQMDLRRCCCRKHVKVDQKDKDKKEENQKDKGEKDQGKKEEDKIEQGKQEEGEKDEDKKEEDKNDKGKKRT